MERAHIPWREGKAYDDWDEISEALYRSIVTRTIQHSDCYAEPEGLNMPGYGFVVPSYVDVSFIEVGVGAPSRGQHKVFIDFATDKEPFDMVRCVTLDECDYEPAADELRIPVQSVEFKFAQRIGVRGHRVVSSVKIDTEP